MSIRLENQLFHGSKGKQSLYDLHIPEKWNGKLVVFIHGYMGYKDWGCWNLVANFFTNAEFGFLKYNISHNGGTIDNPIDFDDLESFAKNDYVKELEDLDCILKLAQQEVDDLKEIHLLGHSRGGGIALLSSHHSIVSKVCTWAAICSIEDRFPKGDDLAQWKSEGVYYRTNGRTHQEMPHLYSQYERFIQFKERLNIEHCCKQSTTPTMIIHGEEDTSVNIQEGKQLAEWLGTDLITIPGTQHTFDSKQPWTEERMPEALLSVCEITLEFFNK